MLPRLNISLPLVVFSDLDGTLLDHSSYSWSAAEPALSALRDEGGALILASSKTAVEIEQLREAMGFADMPAIVENGAGLLGPGPIKDTDKDQYQQIREGLDTVPAELRRKFKGFGDFSIAQITELTGLSEDAADLAAKRQFSEPGIWSGDLNERAAFLEALEAQGIKAKQGGRFLTLSLGATKADGIEKVMALVQGHARKIALGDAPNDIEMLEACDKGYIIKNTHGATLPVLESESVGQIVRTELEGPAGWNAAVLDEISNVKSEKNNG